MITLTVEPKVRSVRRTELLVDRERDRQRERERRQTVLQIIGGIISFCFECNCCITKLVLDLESGIA